MKKKDNLFAVASVRVKENELLTKSDLEQLINAESYVKAVLLLSEKGYDIQENGDYSAVLDEKLNETWNYICTAAPEAQPLKALIVKNDFQNVKAVLKSEVMGYEAESYLVSPCVLEHSVITDAINNRKLDALPDYMRKAVKEAVDILAKTENAQLCDAVLDVAALEAMLSFAKLSGEDIICEYANLFCLSADIKTAYRAIKTGKSSVFLNAAIAENDKISKTDFVNAAIAGEEEFFAYLDSNGFDDYKAALEESPSAFEKYCDDKLLEIIKRAKMTVFGISPLAAYYVAKETEIKSLRIILSAKQSHISSDVIRERMRDLYV